jgi:large subunit ribosomal protein L22
VETEARAKYIRISPRKARLVVDLIRGKDVADAQQMLDYSPKAAARTVAKILNSAIANAEHNNGLDPDELYICRAYVDEGPTLKRFRPRALGRATRINKRTSHITLVLDEREPRPQAKRKRFRRPARKKAAEAEAPLQDEADQTELDADLEPEEAFEEELEAVEPEAPPQDDAPKAPQAEADQPELNADPKAEDSESED